MPFSNTYQILFKHLWKKLETLAKEGSSTSSTYQNNHLCIFLNVKEIVAPCKEFELVLKQQSLCFLNGLGKVVYYEVDYLDFI